ncbi:MAG: tRNA pseudouridine(55) synthase TruB [Methylophilales bacterium]|jgi:tRNA pseudouridine55 synthase|tara:strand:- start:3078 stop:3986 length:909 start_codon:yes stop_codon:yes gene_type:complete
MNENRKKLEISGLLLIDKPLGFSSNQALSKIKWIFSAKKAGHTGTLDPLATGLLPICFGEATKFSSHLLNSEKTYEASIKLGWKSSTGDAEGKLTESKIISLSLEKLQKELKSFIGLSKQTPPMFSALKYNGQPLYKLAREGVKIERQEREIDISKLILLNYSKNIIKIEVTCSKGTYIRTLAEDIANKLGMEGYLTELRRTKIGKLNINEAFSIENISTLSSDKRKSCIKPTEVLVDRYPKLSLLDSEVDFIKNGQPIKLKKKLNTEIYTLFTKSKVFIGLGEIDSNNLLKVVRLISTNIN